MKRPGKKPATDRSFVVALSRGLDVLRAFHPNDGLLGNQEIAARTNLPKPTISRLTYTLTKLGYLTTVPRFEKYQLAPAAMALGYAALANLGVRHLSEQFREDMMRATGGAVAIGGRDRHSMIYFGQSRGSETVGVQLDVGSRVPIATSAMGRAYFWALGEDERRAGAFGRDRRETRFCDFGRRLARRHRRRRRCAQAQRRNRALRFQLRRARIPLHGRAFDQRHWIASACDGKKHRSGTGGSDAAIQKRRQQKAEIRRESCACGRGDQIAFVIIRSGSHRPFAHGTVWARRDDAGTARAGDIASARGSRRQRRVRRHCRAQRRVL